MKATLDQWRYFSENFGTITLDFIEEQRLTKRLREVREEISRLDLLPTIPPDVEIEIIAAQLRRDIDQAELAACKKIAAGDVFLGGLPASWRENRQAPPGGTARHALFNREWRRQAAAHVEEFPATRKLLEAGIILAEERIAAGEIPDDHISPEAKERRLEELKEERDRIQAELSEPKHKMSWRRAANEADVLPSIIGEYWGALKECEEDFFISPEHRLNVSPAWGGVRSSGHADAAQMAMKHPKKVKAARALREYMTARGL